MIAATDLDQALSRDQRTGTVAVLGRAAPSLALIGFGYLAAISTYLTARSSLPLLAIACLYVLFRCRAALGGIRTVPLAAAAALTGVLAGGLAAALMPAAIVAAITWADCDHRRVRPDRDSVVAMFAALVLGFLLNGLRLGPLTSGGSGGDSASSPANASSAGNRPPSRRSRNGCCAGSSSCSPAGTPEASGREDRPPLPHRNRIR